MVIGKLFKFLTGGAFEGSDKSTVESIEYKGFTIEAEPIQENNAYRTAGFITGEINGESKRIQFIRADQHSEQQMAIDHSITKARQIIDEQGTKLLKRSLL